MACRERDPTFGDEHSVYHYEFNQLIMIHCEVLWQGILDNESSQSLRELYGITNSACWR